MSWVYRNGEIVEKGGPLDIRPEPQRSDLPIPFVASDTMDPVQSMLDGRMYTSKAALRATYKAAGVVEVGNDPARLRPKPKPTPDRAAIRQSIKKAMEIVASR